MAVRSYALVTLVLIAAACGDDDSPAGSGEDSEHDRSPIAERDGGGRAREPRGTNDVGELEDAGARDAGMKVTADCPALDERSDRDDCDGVDDDCDGELDEDFEPAPCDGRDSDLCTDGTVICTGLAGTRCSDDGQSELDLCNGLDDDCDPTSPDGSDEPMFGDDCDGDDGDRCLEGKLECDGEALRCSDASSAALDVCNGQDDDCDPATADGSAEATLGQPCDGDDGDLCLEGTIVCSANRLSCSDASGDQLDLCDGMDNDCDARSADGVEDARVGSECDGDDADDCREGLATCSGGSLACSDATGDALETCNGEDDDCDDAIDENVDTDPQCSDSASAPLSVAGDESAPATVLNGDGEAWFALTIRETRPTGTPWYLSASITLTSATGTDYDLYVYCDHCGGELAGSSGEEEGRDDYVDLRVEDSSLDDGFTVLIEIAHFETRVCAQWQLHVLGNTDVSVDIASTCE